MRLSWEVDGGILTEAKEDADGVHLPGAVDEGYDRADELHHERVPVRLGLVFCVFVLSLPEVRCCFSSLLSCKALLLELRRHQCINVQFSSWHT